MNIRPLSLYLSVLAFLGPALSASTVSSFPIDTANLAERICDEDPAERIKLQCHAIVKNLTINLTALAPARASSLRLSGEPVVTSCGLWNAMLTFDPVRLLPIYEEASEELSEDQARGVSSMILEMRTDLRFANQETGETVGFTLRPGKGASRWRLTRAGRPSNPIRLVGESNVQMVTFEGCIPRWVYTHENYEVVQEDGCYACSEDGGEAPPPDDEETPPSADDDCQSQVVPVEPQP